MLFVTPPARNRGAIQRLANLHVAGRDDRPLGLVKLQAGRVPRQAAIIEHPPGLPLQIVDHVLVGHVQDRAGRQNRSPVIHQIAVPAIIVTQFDQVVAERVAEGKQLRKTGNARIDRVPHRVDDLGMGQGQTDQTDVPEIARRLVDQSRLAGGQRGQAGQIGLAHPFEIVGAQ